MRQLLWAAVGVVLLLSACAQQAPGGASNPVRDGNHVRAAVCMNESCTVARHDYDDGTRCYIYHSGYAGGISCFRP
jgi:hypothetical protein